MDHDDEFEDAEEPNLRVLPPLLILSAETTCWSCAKHMKAVAIAAHAVEEEGELMGDPSDTSDLFVLTGIDSMPEQVLAELVARNPNFQRMHSHTAGGSYFANVCDCGRLTGDFYLHAEPGGAFFPTTVEEAAGITVERMPFPEPLEFGGTWGHGTGDFILAHAKLVTAPADRAE